MKTDTFRGLVYYCAAAGRFQIFDYRARPDANGGWVVTDLSEPGRATIAPFRGQTFIAVVRFLELYPLTQSEQSFPIYEPDPEPKPKKPRKRVYWPRTLAC